MRSSEQISRPESHIGYSADFTFLLPGGLPPVYSVRLALGLFFGCESLAIREKYFRPNFLTLD